MGENNKMKVRNVRIHVTMSDHPPVENGPDGDSGVREVAKAINREWESSRIPVLDPATYGARVFADAFEEKSPAREPNEWGVILAGLLIKPDDRESHIGDLIERFHRDQDNRGVGVARLYFWRDVLSLFVELFSRCVTELWRLSR
jgi:hypothetical protein